MRTKFFALAISLVVHALAVAAYFVSLESINPPIASTAKSSVVSLSMFDAAAVEPVSQPPEPKNQSSKPDPVKQTEKVIEKKPLKPRPLPKPVAEKITQPKPNPPKIAPPKPVVETVVEKPAQQESQQVLASQPLGLSDADREGIEDAYKNAVRQAILKNRVYPRQARRRRQEGTVVIAFRLQKNGFIENIRVVSSSGHELLDKAALEAVGKVGQFNPFPPEVNRTFWDFEIPVNFKLS